uniref:Uncharacterized protein n=1 Tax=Lepeophtheirus salmonis TaxID=72036 RepID=A0A0K2TTR5_LEPSM
MCTFVHSPLFISTCNLSSVFSFKSIDCLECSIDFLCFSILFCTLSSFVTFVIFVSSRLLMFSLLELSLAMLEFVFFNNMSLLLTI